MPDEIRSKNENSWFAQHEETLLRQARREHQERMERLSRQQAAGEAKRLRELHYLKCPKCGHDMAIKRVDEIEIEQCGMCEGMFFDKGELDAILLKRTEDRRGFFRKLTGL